MDERAADEVDMIWMRPERAPREPRAPLTRDQIAVAAVQLADARSVDAVSMRQLAAELGCATMSLYRHVRTKDELFELMIDAVTAEELSALPPVTGDWRTDLHALAHARRANMLRHAWLPRLQAGRACLGPHVVAAAEHALTVVDNLGLSIDEMLRVIRALNAFVQGFVQLELAEQYWRAATGSDLEPVWYRQTVAYLEHLSQTGDYPRFNRMLTEAGPVGGDADFEWQLQRVLDGFAAVLPG